MKVVPPGEGESGAMPGFGAVFKLYSRDLSEPLTSAIPAAGRSLHETPEFTALAARYGLTHGKPDWLEDVVARYGLTSLSH
ncbi:hypothetical protein ACTWPT_46310 [Nonomuraea sp. 3N208]|uniref:hypothetical protein n=1 Tax=Nonomuraea sp. 3N208 TaxID=3457421 RepID=UPI003FD17FC0